MHRRAVVLALAAIVAACASRSEPAPAPSNVTDVPACAARRDAWDCAGPSGSSGCNVRCVLGCTLQCFPGHATCDGKDDNGCEVSYLTDPENCGACHARATTCVDGLAGSAPETLIAWGFAPQGLAVDDATAYFACDGVLRSVPTAGGAATTLLEGESFDARAGLTRGDDGFLYWVSAGRVRRMPIGGGPIDTLASGLDPASNLVVHGGVAYVVDATPPSRLVDTTGRTLFPTLGGTLTAIGDVLYAAEHGGRLRAIHFDGTGLADLTASTGVGVTDGAKFYFASDVVDVYDLATSSLSHLGTIAFPVEGAVMRLGDPSFYGRGATLYDHGGCFSRHHGASVVAGFATKNAAAYVRGRIDDAPNTDPPRVAQLAVGATHVFFTTTGRLGEPATLQRFVK